MLCSWYIKAVICKSLRYLNRNVHIQPHTRKLDLNREAIDKDLNDNPIILAEAIQTILRRESYPNPYEALKDLTRTNSHITQESLSLFINELDVSVGIKEELREISPFNYTGI